MGNETNQYVWLYAVKSFDIVNSEFFGVSSFNYFDLSYTHISYHGYVEIH